MLFAFTLSMPRNSSWNGRWSGEERVYARVKSFRTEKLIKRLKENPSHYYNFGDGWCARVDIAEVSRSEAASLRKRSQGFCGYDWMIDSILVNGEILAPSASR